MIGICFVAVIASVVLLRVPQASVGRPGLISGVSSSLFFVAFASRHGPGSICNLTRIHCHEEWSPWPWLVAGLVLLRWREPIYEGEAIMTFESRVPGKRSLLEVQVVGLAEPRMT
jgi:hypothetical protein